jgi:hypothetical protein
VQPTAKQFALPNQPDVSASDTRAFDALYRRLIGPGAGGLVGFPLEFSPSGSTKRSRRRERQALGPSIGERL